MITHVVSYRWRPETTLEQIEAVRVALETLPGLVPCISTYRVGVDLGVGGPGNMDFGIVATFDSIEDWRTYDQHPEHERVRTEFIRPWIAERASVQFRS